MSCWPCSSGRATNRGLERACHSLALVSGWQGGTSPHLTPREGRNMYADREEVEAARDEFYSGDIDAWEFYAIAELWDGDLAELL
jgi:hypothetical protein